MMNFFNLTLSEKHFICPFMFSGPFKDARESGAIFLPPLTHITCLIRPYWLFLLNISPFHPLPSLSTTSPGVPCLGQRPNHLTWPVVCLTRSTSCLFDLNSNSQQIFQFSEQIPSPPSATGNHHSTFCFYDFDYLLRYLIQYFSSCDWLISISIMASRLIHVVECHNFLIF